MQQFTTINTKLPLLNEFDSVAWGLKHSDELAQTIDDTNALLAEGKYVLVVYTQRSDDPVRFYKLRGDSLVGSCYVQSSRSFPLVAHEIKTIDGTLLAVNKFTSNALSLKGRYELCRIDLIPNDAVFLSRTKEINDILMSCKDGETIRIW